MTIKGKVYIVPNKVSRTYEMLVLNDGNVEIGVTHNIITKGQEGLQLHDDHVRYGHGLPVRPNDGGHMAFKYGDTYVHQGAGGSVTIQEGALLRVGLRGAAQTTIELPNLDGGMIELDFKDFQWYGSEASHVGQVAGMHGYAAQAQNKLSMNVGQAAIQARINQLIAAQKNVPACKGEASVTAVPAANGALSHWEVRFANAGPMPWIGTCVFENAQKNSGLGLESMACPEQGSAAVQRIEANGNYGVLATAGQQLRLGVRGYGSAMVPLPAAGTTKLDLGAFRLDSSQNSADFFDLVKVTEKRQEKMNKVQFFDATGKALNAELKPIVYRGQAARTKTDFDPPRMQITYCDATAEQAAGWLIELENRLPAKDPTIAGTPDIGFVATLRVGEGGGAVGWDPKQLPPKKFETPAEKKTWFLPENANVAGVVAAPGATLTIGTRGLGWFSCIPLPQKGAPVDTDAHFDHWAFREDQFARQNLLRGFTAGCRE
jgi:hypothetical protein